MWEKIAKENQEVYGIYIDWEERFFNCPECGEPIYECDWADSELLPECCPICEYVW